MTTPATFTSIAQTERLLQLATPLGPDKFAVRGITGRESISGMFEVDVDLVSVDFDVEPADLIAKQVTLSIQTVESQRRHINGFINRFALAPAQSDHLARYRARIVPALWFLTRTTNCCIFQEKTTQQIVEAILKRYGVDKYEFKLSGDYSTREYCVQYRESAFDFISRLLEEEGICYFFDHSENEHKVIFCDAQSFHLPCKLQSTLSWGSAQSMTENHVFEWSRTTEVRPKRWTQGDFQFKQPSSRLLPTQPSISDVPGPDIERYDYPGRFDSRNDGDHFTRVRIEEEEAAVDVVTGRSGCNGVVPGYTFRLDGTYQHNQEGSFLITSLDYESTQGSMYGGDESPGGTYVNRFTAIPARTLFRPPRVTAKPFIRGPQTAFVTGPAGEEIWVDKFGRVKVLFHWDRAGKADDTSSCWIRVSQSIAGNGWGAMQLPRIGQEVIVEFLEGDPDRPVITGRLYNGDAAPPYALPDEKTKMTLKTLSTPGGGGFNELRFEDKKGSEQVFIHGEKDLDVRIKKDRREWIGNDRHLIVERDKLEQISRDVHQTVQRDLVEQISRDHNLTVSGKEAISITGSHSLSVTGDVIEQFSGNQSTQVTGNCYIKGMNVVIEASTGLTINVGSNFLTINSAGIQMQGTMVMINGAGTALPGMPGNLVSPISPTAPQKADDAVTGKKDKDASGTTDDKTWKLGSSSSNSSSAGSSSSSNAPWHNPDSPENKDKKSWVEIELTDQLGKPVAGEPYKVTLPDGQTVATGTLDDKGQARVEAMDPGNCKVTFPQRDARSWKAK